MLKDTALPERGWVRVSCTGVIEPGWLQVNELPERGWLQVLFALASAGTIRLFDQPDLARLAIITVGSGSNVTCTMQCAMVGSFLLSHHASASQSARNLSTVGFGGIQHHCGSRLPGFGLVLAPSLVTTRNVSSLRYDVYFPSVVGCGRIMLADRLMCLSTVGRRRTSCLSAVGCWSNVQFRARLVAAGACQLFPSICTT